MKRLRFGPVPQTALRLCIDMLLRVASGTSWAGEAVDILGRRLDDCAGTVSAAAITA